MKTLYFHVAISNMHFGKEEVGCIISVQKALIRLPQSYMRISLTLGVVMTEITN